MLLTPADGWNNVKALAGMCLAAPVLNAHVHMHPCAREPLIL